jgi:hypothetical protein
VEYWIGVSESHLGEGTIWTEFAVEGHALRQVEQYNGKWFSSRNDSNEECWLYDVNIKDLDLSGSRKISKEEFETVWQKSA